jgi:hypothetical protein
MRKAKVIKKNIGDDSIVHMFNQMLGTETPDPAIIIPKYLSLKKNINTIISVFSASNSILRTAFPSESDGCDDIMQYVNKLREIKFIDEKKEEVCGEYASLKDNNSVKMIILTYKNLLLCDNKLHIDDKFDDSFILRMPGYEYLPLPFSSLNIKRMWASPNIALNTKRYIFTILNAILNASKDTYKTLLSPDVDVKKFSEVIVSSISKVKKQIPRCEKAFAKIEESVGLLENNFGGYYKDFIQSQNPSTIMESFIIDVSQSSNTDAQTTRQFRVIIGHYKKLTQGKINDPKIKALFDMLNGSFDDIDVKSDTKQ